MRKSIIAAVVVLAGASLIWSQDFDSYDYTSSSSTTTSTYTKPERKFSLFYSIGAGFSLGGINSIDGFGYGLGSAKIIDGNPTNVDDEYLNVGRGLKMDLGAAYQFHENLRLLGGFALTIGVPQASYEYTFTNTILGRTDTDKLNLSSTQFGLKVVLSPTFEIFDLLDMYVGVGLGLYWNSIGYERTEERQDAGGTQRQEETGKVEASASIPFIGMVGIEYPVADRLIVYLDGCFEAMSTKVTEIEYTDTDFDPNDAWDETFDKDDPNEPPPPKIPGSNLAIRLGVRIPLF